MGLEEVRADARVLGERIAAMPESDFDARAIMRDDILPLFEGLCEAIQEGVEVDIADLGEAVDELMDASSDVLHPESAAKLVGTLEIAKVVASELEALAKKSKLDDVTKKRLGGLIQTFRQGAEISLALIQEITIPLDEVPPDMPEAEPDEGDPDQDEDDPDADDEDDVAGGEG